MKKLYIKLSVFIFLFLASGAYTLNAQTNQYLDFDGVDDYVSVTNGSAAIAGSNAISITGWFYDNALLYGQGMMGFRGTGGGFYLIQLNNGQIECRLLNSAGTLYTYTAPNFTTVPQVWQHYAWIYNGTTLTLYLNGNVVGSIAASGTITNATIPFAIGKSLLSGFNFLYAGRIDEVSVWNKALSQVEIQDMIANELTGTEPNLQMYFKFNQGVPGGNNTSITTLTSSVNSPTYDGTLLNFGLTGATSNFNGTLNTHFQAISFPQIGTKLTTDPPFQLGATATSGLPVSYTLLSGPVTLNGDTVTITGAGTVSIKASQAGNINFDSATSVINNFDVVDPSLNTPLIEARNPLHGTDVYMPSLSLMQLAALASINYTSLFSIQSLNFVISGNTYPAQYTGNGHYTAWWTPPAYGPYTIQVVATSNYGATTTVNVDINVVQNINDLSNVQAFTGILLNSDTSSTTRDGILPSYVGAFDTIIATLSITCPGGGCGTYDRVASIDARSHDGEWFEIIRYITPFGVACTHQINLIDYMSLLQGKVQFRANCTTLDNGFIFNLKFDFKAGSPPHKYSRVTKVWKEVYPFGDYANMQPVPAFNYTYENYSVSSKLKLVSTGHGWGNLNTGNAAEFYDATHHISVNGVSTFTQHNWNTCNPNPDGCSPQSGTWTYNRAGWCPGSIAPYFDFDMTPFIANPNVALQYQFYPTYVDLCHPNNPNCVTGSTCTDCADGFNPVLDVNCNLITFFDTSIALTINKPDEINFGIFPNPSAGIFTITSGGKGNKDYTLFIYDITGRVTKQFDWNGERTSVNLSAYPKGIYIVRVSNGTENQFKKLIVE